MNTLWTPSGEEPAGTASGPAGPESQEPSPEEVTAAREQLERVRAELAQTPVADIVANHAIGLWQLAVLHMAIDTEDAEPNLPEAKLAIDAMSSLVEGVVDRLGEHTEPLRQALTNLRLAYVRVSQEAESTNAEGDEEE